MTTLTRDRIQLNVRVDKRIADMLNAKIAHEKSIGHHVTKDQVVADAIVAACSADEPDDDWLPVLDTGWIAPVDPRSNAAVYDWLEKTEAEDPA